MAASSHLATLVAVLFGPVFVYTLVCLGLYRWKAKKAPPRAPQVLLGVSLVTTAVGLLAPVTSYTPVLLGLGGVFSYLAGSKALKSLLKLKEPPAAGIQW